MLAVAGGISGSTTAFGPYTWALGRVRGSQAAVSLALIPVSGVLSFALLPGDAVTARTFAAAAAVVVGVGLAASASADAGTPAAGEAGGGRGG